MKYNDVIADLEQVEEWNEYGELEEQIEEQIDIFGDVPISETSAEAHATNAQRIEGGKVAKEEREKEKSNESVGVQKEVKEVKEQEKARTASETRHISISEPTVNMAMRQAGVEAAKKAGELKKAMEVKAKEEREAKVKNKTAETGEVKEKDDMTEKDKTREAEIVKEAAGSVKVGEESEATDAKTPEVLAAEGKMRTSVDKITSPVDAGELDRLVEDETDEIDTKSTEEQVVDQRRKSTIVGHRSSLAQTTSIDEADTMVVDEPEVEESKEEVEKSASKKEGEKDADKVKKQSESKAKAGEDSEESDVKEPPKKAAKISATDEGEEKVLKGTKPQDQKAADGSKAGDSVGD